MIKKIQSFVFLLLLCGTAGIEAQTTKAEQPARHTYKNGIGIRAGRTSGIDFKHFLNSGHAIEVIAGFWPNAIGLTGLYEKHMGLVLPGLKFYYGAGGHVTAETSGHYYRRHRDGNSEYNSRYGENGFAAGIDGVAGLEYKVGAIPLAISFDLKPFLEVSNQGIIYTALDAGFCVRLAF